MSHQDVTDNNVHNDFRNVMATVCTPVAVVTGIEDGLPYGTTVSAFTSLSMTPPMILVALDGESELLSVVRRTGEFGLNVLSSLQSDLALAFARKGGTRKYDGVKWGRVSGLPRLSGVGGFLSCGVEQVVEGGDHLVLFGRVSSAQPADSRQPLTYHNRVFGTHVPTNTTPG